MKGAKRFAGRRKGLLRKKINGRRPVKRRVISKFRGGGQRANATKVLAQGVGSTVTVPFGSRVGSDLRVWDAKLPMHLPLPRAVGPYLVVRTTRRFRTDARCLVFGAFQTNHNAAMGSNSPAEWSNCFCMHDVLHTNSISGASNCIQQSMPMEGLGSAVTLCPSAISVQIMNPGAIGNTEGIVYAGVMPTQAAVRSRTESWDSYFDKFVEYQTPRLMSAGKLALRGVQINSYPLNMSPLSDFTTLNNDKTGGGGGDVITWNSIAPQPVGFAPILVYNTGGENPLDANLFLEYLCTVEWRVRFDLDNPASSAHVHHPVATDQLWNRLMSSASSLGNAVIDIAEPIANAGIARIGAKAAAML
jgi:hypothetical protein